MSFRNRFFPVAAATLSTLAYTADRAGAEQVLFWVDFHYELTYPTCVECTGAWRSAFAYVWSDGCCGPGSCIPGSQTDGPNIITSCTGLTAAEAQANFAYVATLSDAWSILPNGIHTRLFSYAQRGCEFVGPPMVIAVSKPVAFHFFDNNCTEPQTVQFSSTGSIIQPPVSDDGSRSCSLFLIVTECSATGAVSCQVASRCVDSQGAWNGLLTQANDGTFGMSASLSLCPGGSSVRVIPLNFNDATFDLDSDGRFNNLDVNEILGSVGLAWPSELIEFDLDHDGLIDANEAALLQCLLNSGLSSGIFGDSNMDGVLSCADRHVSIDWSAERGDTDYIITLDVDLDGDLDSTDQAAFAALVLPVDIDFNNDSVYPDDADVIAYFDVLAGGTCSSCDGIDINQNGLYPEDEDVTTFFNALAGGGC